MSRRRALASRSRGTRSGGRVRTSFSRVGWAAVAVFVLVLAGVVSSRAFHRSSGAAAPTGLPGPLGGPDVAQDVNTRVGKPAPAFTLADSDGKRYAVTPGRGRPTVLVFHMGIT
jgi:cytochrome oxidase Cu insertion factor (SCO1/SenC/PrrC family)